MSDLKASFVLLLVVLLSYCAQVISGGVLASLPHTGSATMIQREVKQEDIAELTSSFSGANSKLTMLRCSLSPQNLSEILKAAFNIDSRLETLTLRQSGLNDDVLRSSLARNISLPVREIWYYTSNMNSLTNYAPVLGNFELKALGYLVQ
jgi:hypothetical protein